MITCISVKICVENYPNVSKPINTLTDLRLPKKNSKTGQKCFSFRGAKAWNDLSAEGKLTSFLASFKKILHSIY